MREFFFIFVVILLLLALTALRYRKQISGILGVAKMLKEVKDQASQANAIRGEQASVQLVNCARCGVWVPQDKAVDKGGNFYCSNDCALARVT